MTIMRISDCDKMCIVVCDLCGRTEFASNVVLDNNWMSDEENEYCPACCDRHEELLKKIDIKRFW